jgi:HNH/ENDO VII superfamily nuclease
VADNVVVELIPRDIVDTLNDVLKGAMKQLQPVVKEVDALLDKVIQETEKAVREWLAPEVKNIVLMPSREPGAPALPAPARLRTLQRMPVPAGRRVGHERTHDAPQRGGPEVVVQRADYATAVKELAKTAGAKFLPVLTGLKKPKGGKAAEAEAAAIIEQVKQIINKPVVGKNGPPLPAAAYHYTFARNGHIKGVRRYATWAGSSVPKLRIDNRKLVIGTSWDWKAAARARLRSALGGCSARDDAHHIIPLTLRDHRIVQLAESKGGFEFNGKMNGMCFPRELHGNHPKYTDMVRNNLIAIADSVGTTDWAKVKPLWEQELQNRRKYVAAKAAAKQQLP